MGECLQLHFCKLYSKLVCKKNLDYFFTFFCCGVVKEKLMSHGDKTRCSHHSCPLRALHSGRASGHLTSLYLTKTSLIKNALRCMTAG